MARKAIYKHATQVNTSSYPDDGSSPVGTNEWNEAPDPEGMIGNTPQTASIAIASGALLVTDSVCVVTGESGAADDLDKITITNTNEYDLLYIFGQSAYNVTLKNTASPSVAGQVATISGADEILSATVPTILIRKGNFWYGYGGGTTADGSVTNPKLANMAANTVKVRDANSSGVPSDKAVADTQILIGDGTGFTAASLSGQATMTNTGAVTIGTLNQDTTGSSASCTGNSATATTATTVSANAIGITQLAGIPRGKIIVGDASGDPALLTVGAEDTVLTVDANGDLGWEAPAGGGATILHDYTIQASSYTGGAPSGTTRSVFIRTIDANNEGVFVKIKKNGTADVEVQIA